VSLPSPDNPSDLEPAHWFAKEVQPHEPALRAYLRFRFPAFPDRDDLVQESYLRLLRAKSSGKIRHVKALLFRIARNAALDFFKRKPTVSLDSLPDSSALVLLEDRLHASEAISQKQDLDILSKAVAALPERCRKVMTLRYNDGLSHKEIAARLAVSPETVKTHLMRGVDLCTDYFAKRGLLD
jgi:RNA polymerase sigma factor (sigma-70 family)